MFRFKDVRIGMRLAVGFGVLVLMLIGISIVGYWGVNSVSDVTVKMLQREAIMAEHAARARANVLGLRRYEKDLFLNIGNREKQNEYTEKWKQQQEHLNSRLETLEKAATLKQDKETITTMKTEKEGYEAGFDKVLGMINAGQIKTPQEANAAINNYKDRIHSMENTAKELADESNKRMAAQEGVVKAGTGRTHAIMFMLALIAIVLSVVITTITSRTITRPLKAGVETMSDIAGGNLAIDIVVTGKDETGQLLAAMKKMADNLKAMITSIQMSAQSVASASEELSASSEQMSRGVAEQSGRASQIATSTSEMSQTIVDIAKNAANIASAAEDSTITAKDGQSVVGKSVEEVKEIAETVDRLTGLIASLGDRSKQIGDIISVIKDIADQTNLLALNAAIEAARAGDQGRGFAVVADEVRKLAERTTKATAEIGAMIGTIQDEVSMAVRSMDDANSRVDAGVRDVTKAGESIQIIVDSVRGLQSMVQQIATATEEMSTVSDTINSDIESIARVSNETSISSNQVSQSASDLAKLSSELNQIAGKFAI